MLEARWFEFAKQSYYFQELNLIELNLLGIAYPKAKLLLCAPWKCGSSYWRQLVVKLHNRHDEDWSDRRVRGNDPVYQPPSQPERHQLLNSVDTVAVIVARHPFIRLISAWNEKLNRNYQYGHSMFHREHNLRHYARDHVSSHYIR